MTAARGFALGLAAGVAAAAAFGLAFRDAPHSEVVSVAAPAPEPERIAIESPWADVPPQRRTYTLSLNNPDVVGAEAADHMRPEDLVVGVVVGRDSRAYPWWVMSQYHVVNDTVGTLLSIASAAVIPWMRTPGICCKPSIRCRASSVS